MIPGLLPQPGGFEGFGPLFVGDHPDGLVIAIGPHRCDVVVDLYSAAAATPPRVDEDDDVAAGRLDELLGFEAEFLEGSLQLSQDIAECIGPMEDTGRVDDGGGLMQLEVGGEVIEDDLTGPVERLEGRADSVDVLLRHRQRSISALTRTWDWRFRFRVKASVRVPSDETPGSDEERAPAHYERRRSCFSLGTSPERAGIAGRVNRRKV